MLLLRARAQEIPPPALNFISLTPHKFHHVLLICQLSPFPPGEGGLVLQVLMCQVIYSLLQITVIPHQYKKQYPLCITFKTSTSYWWELFFYFITAVTFSTLCHTLHVYPLWSGTSETVMSTLLLPRLDKWETIFVNISLLLTESPLLNCTRCIALNRTEGSPSQSEPWSAGKVIYDGSHDMWVLHSSQVSSLYSFIKKVSFTRLKSFEQLLHGLYVADIFWTPVTARSIFITCSVNSPWVSRQSLILLPQQEKHSGVCATGQANGIFHISS